MQLAILTAVLAALAAAESGGGPVGGLVWRLVVVASASLVAPLAALLGAQRLALALDADTESDNSIARLQSIVVGLWMSAVAIVLFVAQWPRIVRSNWALAGWPLVDELAVLMPVVVPLLLVWAALYRLERAVQLAACRARQIAAPPPRLARYLWLHVRHQLGLVLLPPLVVIGIFEILGSLRISGGQSDAAWWFALPLLGTMLVLMPVALRRIWRTTPLPAGPLRESLEAICRRRKCCVRDILTWHTDGSLANAAVVGISRWLRYMLLTDVLLARLSPDEVAAVVRHELGHLRRWHLPLRLVLLVLPLVAWIAIKNRWPDVEAAVTSALGVIGVPVQNVTGLGAPLAMLLYAVLVVGWYSRLLEHDADLDACLADDGHFDPQAAEEFCRALLTLCGRSRESRLGQWLHPPVARRLEFLRCVADGSGDAAALRRRLRWIAALIAALYLVTAVLAAS